MLALRARGQLGGAWRQKFDADGTARRAIGGGSGRILGAYAAVGSGMPGTRRVWCLITPRRAQGGQGFSHLARSGRLDSPLCSLLSKSRDEIDFINYVRNIATAISKITLALIILVTRYYVQ